MAIIDNINYLGFIVRKDRLLPQPEKVVEIEKMSVPSNKRDIQVFFGMVGY